MQPVEVTQFEADLRPRLVSSLKLQTDSIEPQSLRAAVQHLLGGGKLFRPMLALATRYAITSEDYASGSPAEKALVPAATLEMVHTFTLIHDDLPCMDDAELRRGLPAVHRAFDEAMAVLAGDDLLAMAVKWLTVCREWLPAETTLQLVEALAYATHRVVQGQVEDIGSEGASLDLSRMERLHLAKTGALIGAACRFGGILAGTDQRAQATLGSIGEEIGLAFQIRDDLLSLHSDEVSMGKTLSTDLEKQKSTFPRLLGVEGAQAYALALVGRIEGRIDSLELKQPELLKAYARLALQRSA